MFCCSKWSGKDLYDFYMKNILNIGFDFYFAITYLEVVDGEHKATVKPNKKVFNSLSLAILNIEKEISNFEPLELMDIELTNSEKGPLQHFNWKKKLMI